MVRKEHNYNFIKIKNKIISLFFIFIFFSNMFLITFIFSNEKVSSSYIGEDSTPPSFGNWIIDSPGNIITNETIILNGDLLIKNSGSLIFKNITLLMNCSFNGTFNIEVEKGGAFYIYDYDDNSSTKADSSIITSAIPDGKHRFHFYIKKDAYFEMKNSELHECGYFLDEVPAPYWMTGLCIEASNSLIENCIISNNNYGLLLYYYSNNSKILNSIISYNFYDGLIVSGYPFIHSLINIEIQDCIIASNGIMSQCNGISISDVDNSLIKNCSIYHHSHSGIYFGVTNNIEILFCNILNNNYGIFDMSNNNNTTIENNTIVGNLEYAIYSYYDTSLKAQHNYFGTNNDDQIKASIHGHNIDYSNWLKYRDSNIPHINTTEEWINSIKNLNNGLIINGNLTIEDSNIILNNSYGKNFIQVNGRLSIKNSTVNLNKSNPEIISVYGGYSVIYSYNSSGELYNSEFQQQKGICINNNDMKINNITIFGNFSKFKPIYGLLLMGNNITVEHCNISDISIGINIKSDDNTIRNCYLFSNSLAINLIRNNNKIFNNNLIRNSNGIQIFGFDFVNESNSTGNNNIIFNNNISNNLNLGIYIIYGSNNKIIGSNISYNDNFGVAMSSGINNTITNCNIAYNGREGVYIYPRMGPGKNEYNKIYHNNFISNAKSNSSLDQAFDKGNENEWDDGYPNGGNYWDDYLGNDIYSGENQDIIGSDCLGDSPIIIPGSVYPIPKDNYPLMYAVGIIYKISSPFLYQPSSPDSDGSFTLSWTSVPNATNYTLYEDQNDNLILINLSAVTSYDIVERQNGTYRYFIQAKNDKVVSKKSNNVTVVVDYLPDIPKNLIARPIPDGNILNITWDLNEVDTINYSLWSNYTSSWKELKNITTPNCLFIHDGLINDLKYYYKIQAWDGINQSSRFSKIIFGIPGDIKPPEAPYNLKAKTLSNNTIELIWTSSNDLDLAGFDIYRSKNSEINFTKINSESVLNSSYLDKKLDGNTTYFYKVLAFDELPNYSNFSNVAFNTTHLTPPMVISFSPVGTDVPITSNITIIFNKPMLRSSVEKNLIIQPKISGEYIWSDNNCSMILNPTNKLVENTTYNITVLKQAKDFEGEVLKSDFSWEFTTVLLPKVITYQPQGNSVPTDMNITILFDRSMNKLSVEHGFSIEPSINGTFKWSAGDKKLIFVPNNELNEGTGYTIAINKTASDLAGNTLTNDFVWTFTVGDFTPPEVIYFSPKGENVGIDSVITITFSEKMNKTSVENNFIITNNIEGKFQWRDNSLIFIPNKDLSYNTLYEVTVDTGAWDKWGNPIKGNNSWKFKTERKASDDQEQIQYILLVTSISIILFIIILILFIVLKNKKREKTEQEPEEPPSEEPSSIEE